MTMGFFKKLADGLRKTRDAISGQVDAVLASFTKIDEELFEELEDVLIGADVGVHTTMEIVEQLRERVKEKRITDPAAVKGELKAIIGEILGETPPLTLDGHPSVILVIGVNGVGKTTSIGKLAHLYAAQGKRVLLAAGDTFRAAAAQQLQIWADRAGVPMVRHEEGSDPASVIYDAVSSAIARGYDLVICDTAGRLHNKKSLMNELSKISRVAAKAGAEGDIETLLVLDAVTGQNAIQQAAQFIDAASATGIILTKLDGTAKGGSVISIKSSLGLPVRFVGVGEGIDDLMPFDPRGFVDALFLKEDEAGGQPEQAE